MGADTDAQWMGKESASRDVFFLFFFLPPLCFFSSSLAIYSSRAASCHLLRHKWSRNEPCLFVAAYVQKSVSVSDIMSASIVSILHFSHLKILLGCKLGSKCCHGATMMLDVWFIALQQVTHLCNFCRKPTFGRGVLATVPAVTGQEHTGQTAHQL